MVTKVEFSRTEVDDPVKMRMELLSGEKFAHFWPEIETELKRVPHIWADRWTLESIRSCTEKDLFQCWAAGDEQTITLILFSQVVQYPAVRMLQIFLAFGRVGGLVPMIEATLERFCQAKGCAICEVTGRPGWEPALRPFGFRRSNVTLTRVVPKTELN